MNVDTVHEHGVQGASPRGTFNHNFRNESSMSTEKLNWNMSMRRTFRHGPLGWLLLAVTILVMSLSGTSGVFAEESTQQTFETPEAAAAALVKALGAEKLDDLFKILDPKHKDEILGGDEIAARVSMKKLYDAAQDMYRVRPDVDDSMMMLIGNEVWPLPFPIVKENDRWRFDTVAGLEEVISRRIGRNELNAISAARAYVAAQDQYASVDRDGDEVLEFAQRLASRSGRRDGLYWEVGPGEELSPFGPLVADARDYLNGRDPGDPYMGYYFRVLTRQGLNPPGGRYDYVINNNMIGGFALIAFPADYDNSGIVTFVISHQGVVYEKDLGEDTDIIAGGIGEYNPDETWNQVDN